MLPNSISCHDWVMSQVQPAGKDVAELLADDLIAVAEQIVVLRERSGRMPPADSQFMRELLAEKVAIAYWL